MFFGLEKFHLVPSFREMKNEKTSSEWDWRKIMSSVYNFLHHIVEESSRILTRITYFFLKWAKLNLNVFFGYALPLNWFSEWVFENSNEVECFIFIRISEQFSDMRKRIGKVKSQQYSIRRKCAGKVSYLLILRSQPNNNWALM